MMRVVLADYVGKKFSAVENALRIICADGRYSLALMDPGSPANIDARNTHRMNVYVAEVVTNIKFG
jgi:hypothetical protein